MMPKKPYASVVYPLPNGGVWKAIVFRTNDGWQLKTVHTRPNSPGIVEDRKPIDAGMFKTGKALIKFVRQKAKLKCGDAQPTFDNLHKLKTRHPASVVPDCYEPMSKWSLASDSEGRGLPECVACPYRSQCREPPAHLEILPISEVKEPEEIFLARLKAKIKAQYGDDE
jgi:hypothetical protein